MKLLVSIYQKNCVKRDRNKNFPCKRNKKYIKAKKPKKSSVILNLNGKNQYYQWCIFFNNKTISWLWPWKEPRNNERPTTASDSVSHQLNPQVTDDRPGHGNSCYNHIAHVYEGRGEAGQAPWGMADVGGPQGPSTHGIHSPEVKDPLSGINVRWDTARGNISELEEHSNGNYSNRTREGKRLTFLNEQNLVWTPNGINPQWPLTLYHKLQVRTLDRIHNANLKPKK